MCWNSEETNFAKQSDDHDFHLELLTTLGRGQGPCESFISKKSDTNVWTGCDPRRWDTHQAQEISGFHEKKKTWGLIQIRDVCCIVQIKATLIIKNFPLLCADFCKFQPRISATCAWSMRQWLSPHASCQNRVYVPLIPQINTYDHYDLWWFSISGIPNDGGMTVPHGHHVFDHGHLSLPRKCWRRTIWSVRW